ncbi:MAG: HD domain-containing protein [Actinobacteria bacterium]|nr:HD domain-containing protein [Actinomycetota bacterium]MCB9388479.1 HD domain-containing protein [Acidimicrobiia bacterium]
MSRHHGAYGEVLVTDGGAHIHQAHADSHAKTGGGVWNREAREAALASSLAPGATLPLGAGDRALPEAPDPYRLCFERDRDRIKHSTAFRRLAGKCQVFIAPDNDMLRNRLTHAIEVAQVAVAISEAGQLCVPLTEAIALGHDCGHGPAGHASERAFEPFLPQGYDHAAYGADVVLTDLNLCAETLDGIRNHSWKLPAARTPEGEVVSWADRIAYVCHDFEDAVRAGIVTETDLPASVADVVGRGRSQQLGTFIRSMLTCIAETSVVGMMEPEAHALEAFRNFNYDRIYLRPASMEQGDRVIDLLGQLVERFVEAPSLLPIVKVGLRDIASGSDEAAEQAVRYVSGMTDRFALGLAVDLLGWNRADLPSGVP